DPHPGKLVSFSYRKSSVAGRDHHLSQGVHGVQFLHIYNNHTVMLRNQLYLSFLWLRRGHSASLTDLPQYFRRVIFVQHGFVTFPHIDMILAEAQENGDIFLPDDVALSEGRALRHAFYDLCDIMA